MSRVLKNKENQITQKYKKSIHDGVDLVGYKSSLDYIIAYADGKVVALKNDYSTNDRSGNSYGNYVKIKHSNGYFTLYAHLKYNSIPVKIGDEIKKGQIIGYMGNTGHSTGAHLHFEVRNENDQKIDPTPYLEKDIILKAENACQQMQKALNLQYNCGLDEDGHFGPKTSTACNKYQLYKNKKAPIHIKWLQGRLIELGYSCGPAGIDGNFGPDTLEAVYKFQKDHKLKIDGYVGKDTANALVS